MTREHLRLATEEFNSAPDGLPLNSLCIDLAGGAENIGDGCSLSEQKLKHLEIHIELLDTHPTISGKCALSQVLITPEFLGEAVEDDIKCETGFLPTKKDLDFVNNALLGAATYRVYNAEKAPSSLDGSILNNYVFKMITS